MFFWIGFELRRHEEQLIEHQCNLASSGCHVSLYGNQIGSQHRSKMSAIGLKPSAMAWHSGTSTHCFVKTLGKNYNAWYLDTRTWRGWCVSSLTSSVSQTTVQRGYSVSLERGKEGTLPACFLRWSTRKSTKKGNGFPSTQLSAVTNETGNSVGSDLGDPKLFQSSLIERSRFQN